MKEHILLSWLYIFLFNTEILFHVNFPKVIFITKDLIIKNVYNDVS